MSQDRSDIDLAVLCPKALDSKWYQVLSIIGDADPLLKVDCVRFDHLSKNDKIKEKKIFLNLRRLYIK